MRNIRIFSFNKKHLFEKFASVFRTIQNLIFLRLIHQSSVYKVTRTQYLRVVTFRYRLFVDYIHRQVLSSIQFVIKWNANVAPKSYLNCFAHLTLAQSRKCKLIFNQKKLIMFNNDK